MSTRWDHKPWHPEVEYSRRPAQPPVDWGIVVVYAAPLVVWISAILLLLWAEGWIG